jgi:peptide-methionine (S)-S-oxide reductase
MMAARKEPARHRNQPENLRLHPMHRFLASALTLAAVALTASDAAEEPGPAAATSGKTETATFGAGCYWCTEAVVQRIQGVKKSVSGFMGGHVDNPSYEAVCTGTTGHAEVIQVEFDPSVVSFAELVDIFWQLHDPTTLNRQGADVGTQYRSVIFYHSEAQKAVAEQSKKNAASKFQDPIVTEISPASTFYPAKADHQNYYNRNKFAGYCRVVIHPKLKKLGLDQAPTQTPEGSN